MYLASHLLSHLHITCLTLALYTLHPLQGAQATVVRTTASAADGPGRDDWQPP